MNAVVQEVSNDRLAEVDFRFREKKDGANVTKRPTVSLKIPVPNRDDIAEILVQDGKSKTLDAVISSVQELIIGYVRGLVNADTDFDQAKLDKLVEEGKVTLEAIANLPRSERNTITNSDLEAFVKVFKEVGKANKIASDGAVDLAGDLFILRIKSVLGKNDVLGKLKSMLEKFAKAASEEQLTEQMAIVEWLSTKIDEALKVEVDASALD